MRLHVLAFPLCLLMVASYAAASAEDSTKEAEAALKTAARSDAVEAELEETDGVSIVVSDPANWKIIALGTGTFDFDDADERRDAIQEATLEAKSALAKFMKEKLSSKEELDRLVDKKSQKSRADGKETESVSKETLKKTLTSIRNSADAVLAGVITLETTTKMSGKSGTARVKIGQSQKTLAAAKRFRERTDAALKTGTSNEGPSSNGDGPAEGKTIKQKSKSDF